MEDKEGVNAINQLLLLLVAIENGDEIMKICGLPPSKKIGELKSAIEEAILDGKIGNNYDEAYQYLLKLKNEML